MIAEEKGKKYPDMSHKAPKKGKRYKNGRTRGVKFCPFCRGNHVYVIAGGRRVCTGCAAIFTVRRARA